MAGCDDKSYFGSCSMSGEIMAKVVDRGGSAGRGFNKAEVRSCSCGEWVTTSILR